MQVSMTKIDLKQLSIEIGHLQRHQALYRVLKEGLSKKGHWKNKRRGRVGVGRSF